MEIIHDDARRALLQSSGPFDVVIGDVFHDVAIPQHLVTREFFELVDERLADGGMLAMNVVDAFPDPRLVKAVLNALRSVFPHTAVWVDQLPDEATRVTYIITARHRGEWPERIGARRGPPRAWYRIDEPMARTGTPFDELPVLSDRYAPVERLIADLLTGANR